MTRRLALVLLIVIPGVVHSTATPQVSPERLAELRRLENFEREIAADPENIRLAAEYRQAVIEAEVYDRSIRFLEDLAGEDEAGPNVHVSLALAYVDKVPPSGDFGRLYLARDAIGELTRSIALRPSVLAYYVRGLINLYFNNFIFHRLPTGIADLEAALEMAEGDPGSDPALTARVLVSLGDGLWRNDERDRALAVWTEGDRRFPGDWRFEERLAGDASAREAVKAALYAGTRVDTSLRDLHSLD